MSNSLPNSFQLFTYDFFFKRNFAWRAVMMAAEAKGKRRGSRQPKCAFCKLNKEEHCGQLLIAQSQKMAAHHRCMVSIDKQ